MADLRRRTLNRHQNYFSGAVAWKLLNSLRVCGRTNLTSR